ncbi:hypothetical protein [Phaeodactylibacter sp.]|uniref:hypothetical protein n=1 Tax=Phaeodactylibacter sp. TaxID=1940289 RepID=UPI0025D60228|nr:hypothetical protein [Phaeodactylibacter sp.]MCI5093662.1 hypothetical protein [Phaeodactylibacter sp.]
MKVERLKFGGHRPSLRIIDLWKVKNVVRTQPRLPAAGIDHRDLPRYRYRGSARR